MCILLSQEKKKSKTQLGIRWWLHRTVGQLHILFLQVEGILGSLYCH